jgi:hypothetical protein
MRIAVIIVRILLGLLLLFASSAYFFDLAVALAICALVHIMEE